MNHWKGLKVPGNEQVDWVQNNSNNNLRHCKVLACQENDNIGPNEGLNLAHGEHEPLVVALPLKDVFSSNHFFAKVEHPRHMGHQVDNDHHPECKSS